MPEEADIIEGQIIAATPVYKLSADDTAIASLQIEIPMPASFGADSELVVLQHVGDTWSRVSGIHDDSNPMSVICDVSALPVHVMAAQVVPGTGDAALFKEATAALSQTLHTHCNVGFLCFSKCVERTARFTVVLECCPQKTLDARRQAWTLQGFKEQSRENMAESRPEAFSIKSLEEFHILFCDKNNLLRADLHRRVLSFHRKRLNVLTFEIDLKGRTVQFMNCRLVVSKRVDTDNAKQGDKQRLTYFDVNLVVNPVDAGWSKSTETVRMSQNPRNTSSARSVRGLEQSQMRNVKTARQRDLSSKSMADAGTSGSVVGIERSPKPMEARALNVKPAMDGLARLQATVERALNNVDPVPDIEIVVTPPEEQEAPEEKSRDPDMKYLSNNSNAVLLDDALLDDLVEAFGASWYKAFVLMGLPFMEIDTALLTSKNVNVTKRQMFRTWRNVNQSRDDLGVPLLMGALFKGGFRNVAARLQTAVKSWFEENKSSEVPFKYWVIEAYKNSDLLVPPDYPKPMSDPNLVLMSDELPLSRNLARALAIPDDVAEDIINSKHLLIDEIRVMKMLTCFRDRQARSIDALEALLEALLSLRCESMYKYAIMCAKAWVKRTATRKDDPFRSQVDTLMQKC
ncbi:uncharacterized protein LOC127882178 isoform X1 [Dreissena polymorpha]|nr:uncharacterized protein LOC127882178 isoform X1 [Dreissena polymorpha]